MSGAIHGESARIYQFPVGGRAGVVTHRPENRFAREAEAIKAMRLVIGDSWYHDAAIEDSSPTRKS
jgi:hypothetical protein